MKTAKVGHITTKVGGDFGSVRTEPGRERVNVYNVRAELAYVFVLVCVRGFGCVCVCVFNPFTAGFGTNRTKITTYFGRYMTDFCSFYQEISHSDELQAPSKDRVATQ